MIGERSRDDKPIPGGGEQIIPGSKVVLLQPTRGLRLRLSVSHVLPGVVLLLSGITALLEEGFGFLALAEVFVGAAVPIAVLIEYLKPAHKEREAVGWVEVFAGLMLAVEGVHIRHPGHVFQPALFYFIIAAITLALAFGYSRIPRIRRMTLDERGFRLRTSALRRMKAEWNEIAGYEATPDAVRLVMRGGGRRTIRLRSIENRTQVLQSFTEFARRHEIGVDEPAGSSER